MEKGWLEKKAKGKGILMGVEINLVVDNSPIDRRLKDVKVFQKPKNVMEIIFEEVIKSSKKMIIF